MRTPPRTSQALLQEPEVLNLPFESIALLDNPVMLALVHTAHILPEPELIDQLVDPDFDFLELGKIERCHYGLLSLDMLVLPVIIGYVFFAI